jgi:carboxypeptidase C (cathepsin A)
MKLVSLPVLFLAACAVMPPFPVMGKKSHATPPRYQPSDFLVQGLEEIEPAFQSFDGSMFAGRLPIDLPDDYSDNEPPSGEYMFWLFQPNNATAMDTVTIWLNGGPGCSSFFAGVMFECAPVTVPHHPAGYPKSRFDEPLVPNEFAWTKATNMLFVEQPGGVGFSSGPTPEIEADLSDNFYGFLVNFYDTFPDYQTKRLFIFGESYAGYYVPSIAHRIYRENQYGSYRNIPLTGLGLGNAWMDALYQGPTVIDYAWWHGMIDSPTRDGLHNIWEQCKQGGEDLEKPFHPFTIPDECGISEATLMAAGAGIFPDMSPNTYDVTTWDTYPLLNNNNSTILRFYNNPKVKEVLHAPTDVEFHGCILGAGRRRRMEKQEEANLLPGELLLAHDKPDTTVPYVAELLDDAGIRVLVYNGNRDLSCNAPGSEMLLDGMRWNGESGWKNASRGLWVVDGKPSGYSRSYANLNFLVVSNSGHLVPNNLPMDALDLITRFVTDEKFNDVMLPTFDLPQTKSKHVERAIPVGRHDAQAYFHAMLLLVVAIVCFFSGMISASRIGWGYNRGYTPIASHEEHSSPNGGGNPYRT